MNQADADQTPAASTPAPRPGDRLVYSHDSGIVAYQTWDPFSPDQLRQVVDDLADVGVDIYVQLLFAGGLAKPPGIWRPRLEGVEFGETSRFQGLHEQGTQPLEILIDRAHERGVKFVAAVRMSDRHSTTGHGFVARHPELQLERFRGALDYSHEPSRAYMLAVMAEIVGRFDVDGLELNFIRMFHCFPAGAARDRQPVMTDFVRQVRALLDDAAGRRNRRLLLGARVPQTLEECHGLGYDVPAWIRSELIDYVAPCDAHCSDFNAPYESFAALTRAGRCRLYPTVHATLMTGVEKFMRPENYRALAHTMYAAGADGVSIFNYMYHWARRAGVVRYGGPVSAYPLALDDLRPLRDPDGPADRMSRHYVFYPLWGATRYGGTSPSGATKHDRLVLSRAAIGRRETYAFRLFEDVRAVRATLFFRAAGLKPGDTVAIDLNGHAVPPARLARCWHPDGRWDQGVEWEDSRGHGKRRWQFERPLPPFTSFWFDCGDLPVSRGVNALGVRLVDSDPDATDDPIIDEVEVTVMHMDKPRTSP